MCQAALLQPISKRLTTREDVQMSTTKPKKTLNCGAATSDDFSRDYVAGKVSLQSFLRGGRYMFAVCRQVTAVAYIIGLLPSRSLRTLENLHLIH